MAKVQVTIELPESLLKAVKDIAAEDGVSPEHFISLAIAEKVASLSTLKMIAQRLDRDPGELLREILAQVPNVEPEEYDRL